MVTERAAVGWVLLLFGLWLLLTCVEEHAHQTRPRAVSVQQPPW